VEDWGGEGATKGNCEEKVRRGQGKAGSRRRVGAKGTLQKLTVRGAKRKVRQSYSGRENLKKERKGRKEKGVYQ